MAPCPEQLFRHKIVYGGIGASGGGDVSFRVPHDSIAAPTELSDGSLFSPKAALVADGCTTRGASTSYYRDGKEPAGSLHIQVLTHELNGPAHVKTIVTPNSGSPITQEFLNLKPGTSVNVGDGITIYHSPAPDRS